MKILELFSGTESFGNIAVERGHEVFSVDNDIYHNPSLCKSILDLTIKDIPFKPDIIWASPPCTTFSVMSNYRHWDFPHPKNSKACINLAFVLKTLELIEVLQPKYWFIENPRGLLRKFPFMEKLYRKTITYCQYGTLYMKPTDIWTNCLTWTPRKMCKNGDPCHYDARRGSHTGVQGKGFGSNGLWFSGSSRETRILRAVVPRQLCKEIMEEVEKHE